MSEMVERVARAIAKAGIGWLEKHDPKRMTLTWAEIPDEIFARAAIEAMREPTGQMLIKGDMAVCNDGTMLEIWETMIDEALK